VEEEEEAVEIMADEYAFLFNAFLVFSWVSLVSTTSVS
jgi:hypothetical protein